MFDEINLWCWVHGDELNNRITIDCLKEAIRAKKTSFQNIAADYLKRLKVSEWY